MARRLTSQRPQFQRLTWPPSQSQWEAIDGMLETLFRRKDAATADSTSTGTPGQTIWLPGQDGADGEDGRPGVTGATGPTGATGATGPAGPSGATGVGVMGPPGMNGESVEASEIWFPPGSSSSSSGGTTAPGGVDKNVQYNNAGAFAGIPNSAFDNYYLKTLAAGAGMAWAPVGMGDLQQDASGVNNVSVTQHGFVPVAPNDNTKYLDGTGAWSTVGPQRFSSVTNLTDAQVRSLQTSPITLVSAKGASTIIVPVQWALFANVTSTFTLTQTLTLRWVGTTQSCGLGTIPSSPNTVTKKVHVAYPTAANLTINGTTVTVDNVGIEVVSNQNVAGGATSAGWNFYVLYGLAAYP